VPVTFISNGRLKVKRAIFVGAIFLGAVLIGQLSELPTAKVTLKVVDEEGNPVSGATVNFAFLEAHPKWGAAVGVAVKVTTNVDGMASGSGHSDGTIGCSVEKDGYYQGGPGSFGLKDPTLGRWKPWNAVYPVILKKIINPIPMYATKVETEMPAMDQPIGFDLAVGDWVQPFGKGTISDFIFTMSHTYNGPNDFNAKLTLAFKNNDDGIQVAPHSSDPNQGWSQLIFPGNAPQDGYLANWTTSLSSTATVYNEEHSNGIGYFFRVRTIKTAQGDIQSAEYGKIKGDISIFGVGDYRPGFGGGPSHPGIAFVYYFNPTGTTNLEFDPKKNLLKVSPLQAIAVQDP
jgi:hypothetical protein